MTVYADEAFLLNAAIDYLLLVCAAKLCGDRLLRLRLALAAAFGGAYAAAALLPALACLRQLPVKLLSVAGMLLIAFGAGRRLVRTGLVFFAAACAFAGAALVAAQVFGTGVLVLPGGTFYAVSFLGLLLLAALVYLLCDTVFACTVQHGGQIQPLTLLLNGRQAPIYALHDTGCTLKDPLSGEQVLVAEAASLQTLLPQAQITPDALKDPASLLLRLKTLFPALSVRLLHYRSVGVQTGLLLCLRCEVQTRTGKRRSCLVAFSPTPVSETGTYNALTGGTIK